jgi:hypothetical protein
LVAQAAPATLKIEGDEIRFDGTLRAVNLANHSLVLDVTSFVLPSGKSSQLPAAKPKTVILQPQTVIRTRDGAARAIALTELKEGLTVSVVGKDLGSGKDLPAREVVVDLPAKSAPAAPPASAPPVTAAPLIAAPVATGATRAGHV